MGKRNVTGKTLKTYLDFLGRKYW